MDRTLSLTLASLCIGVTSGNLAAVESPIINIVGSKGEIEPEPGRVSAP